MAPHTPPLALRSATASLEPLMKPGPKMVAKRRSARPVDRPRCSRPWHRWRTHRPLALRQQGPRRQVLRPLGPCGGGFRLGCRSFRCGLGGGGSLRGRGRGRGRGRIPATTAKINILTNNTNNTDKDLRMGVSPFWKVAKGQDEQDETKKREWQMRWVLAHPLGGFLATKRTQTPTGFDQLPAMGQAPG